MSAAPGLAVDHLVVAAHTLAQGVQWCKTTLGVTPGPGGEHPLMGTHNRLLSVATDTFALAYFEIIAINPAAPGPRDNRKRWFGLDDPQLQQRLAEQGPQLVHWVARTGSMAFHRWRLIELGYRPGQPVAASRPTPQGLLQWKILLRPDGMLMAQGAVPTLIEWQGPHPVQSMPASGVTLSGLQVAGRLSPAARRMLQAPGVETVESGSGSSPSALALTATLQTPLGPRQLCTAV